MRVGLLGKPMATYPETEEDARPQLVRLDFWEKASVKPEPICVCVCVCVCTVSRVNWVEHECKQASCTRP